MTPAEIVSQVVSLSIGEDNPAADMEAIAYKYLNAYYRELFNEIAPVNLNRNGASQTVSLTSGSGTLSPEPQRIIAVQHVQSLRFLDATNMVDALYADPGADDTGNPVRYWIENATTIKVSPTPTCTNSLKVIYSAKPAELTSTSTEADIKIPSWHHDLLVWGTMYYMNTWERGFNWQPAVQQAKGESETRKARLLGELYNSSTTPVRVRSY